MPHNRKIGKPSLPSPWIQCWKCRRHRSHNLIIISNQISNSLEPPTQFSPVRKSFRGRKTRCRRLNRPAKTMNAIVCWFGTSCALSPIPAWDKTKLRTKVRTDRFSETHLSNLVHAGQFPVNLGQTNFNETQMSDIYWHADSPLDLGQNPVLTLLVKRPAGDAYMRQWSRSSSSLIQVLAYRRMAPSHCMNQYWVIVNWTHRKILQWNSNQNSTIFIEQNAFENVVCSFSPNCRRPNVLPIPALHIFHVTRSHCCGYRCENDIMLLLDHIYISVNENLTLTGIVLCQQESVS